MKEWIMLNLVLAIAAAVVAWFVILPVIDTLLERIGL